MSSAKWPKEPPHQPKEKESNSSHSLVLGYYGFREEPFGVTPNPRFLYFSPSHREALASLVYAIEAKRGFSALIADPGTGKTTLLFDLLEKMKSSARTVFLFRPNSNARELLQSMLSDLGLDVTGKDVPHMHETLNSVLLQELQAGRHFLWILDEAQDVDVDVLEVVRLLSNFETTNSKLMHIVLAGQPALLEKLERPELLQLRQRVSAVVHLSRLSTAEVCEYIDHRLRLSGCKNPDLFPLETKQLIAKVSRGIPRNINNLCFLCLSLGFAEQSPVITPEILKAVLADHEAVNQIANRAKAKASSSPATEARDFPRDIPNIASPPPLQDPPRASTAWLDQELGYLQPPPPQRSKFLWGFGAVLVFLVIPLGLFVIASDSNINFLDGNSSPALESLVQSVTGYNPHVPDPPAATAQALRPPSLPDNLADLTKPPTSSATTAEPTAEDSASAKLPEAAAAKTASPASKSAPTSVPAARPTGPRTVYAVRDQTIFQLAMEYYGRANWTIVAKIRAQNPQMEDTSFVTIERGQRVVLPDLSPEYPWRVPISTSSPSKAPSKYSRRF